jgi:hypothetical protein
MAHGRAGTDTSPWAAADQAALVAMWRNVTVPLIRHGSTFNGNWELSMIDALAGISVYTADAALFNQTLSLWRQRLPAYFYLHALDGPKPVPPPRGRQSWHGQATFNASVDGVCAETCRDLMHTHYGMASALYAAETAGLNGVDLRGEMAPRLVPALEFHARLLLNLAAAPADVCAGAGVTLAYPPTFDVAYDQYARRGNASLPFTKQHIAKNMRGIADPAAGHVFVYQSLTHGGLLW